MNTLPERPMTDTGPIARVLDVLDRPGFEQPPATPDDTIAILADQITMNAAYDSESILPRTIAVVSAVGAAAAAFTVWVAPSMTSFAEAAHSGATVAAEQRQESVEEPAVAATPTPSPSDIPAATTAPAPSSPAVTEASAPTAAPAEPTEAAPTTEEDKDTKLENARQACKEGDKRACRTLIILGDKE